MKELAGQQSDDWRRLGVSLLHRLVIDELLGSKGHPKPTYVHEVSEVVEGLRGEGSQAESDSDEPYTLAALVMPAKLESRRSDQPAQGTNAGQEHLFLSETAQRPDVQSTRLDRTSMRSCQARSDH